jgi:hypothetical protein
MAALIRDYIIPQPSYIWVLSYNNIQTKLLPTVMTSIGTGANNDTQTMTASELDEVLAQAKQQTQKAIDDIDEGSSLPLPWYTFRFPDGDQTFKDLTIRG